jgi:nucleotide sugar dehydrogenase
VPFPGEHDLAKRLKKVVDKGNLKSTIHYAEAIPEMDVIIIVVPLVVDDQNKPNFANLDYATNLVGQFIKDDALVCYETTLPVGTTRNRFTKMLEEKSGKKVGEKIFVVFSPERVFTGRIFQDLKKYPKIVGGITEECAIKARDFYNSVLDFETRSDLKKPNGTWIVNSAESAEFVKLAETTYRDLNIALANQFAKLADKEGLNVYEVIEAANTQPFSHIHLPGIYVGGHCIPVYPRFYLLNDPEAELIKEGRKINEGMPRYAFERISNYVKDLKTKNILILGISYRAGVKEDYMSGAYALFEEFQGQVNSVSFHDLLYTTKEIEFMNLPPFDNNKEKIDIIIIQNENEDYTEFIAKGFKHEVLVYDGRNIGASGKRNKNWRILGNESIGGL